MSSRILKMVSSHLEALQLNPDSQETPYQSLVFSLSEGIQSELILLPSSSRQTEFSLLTAMDVTPHPELDVFALSLSPSIAPAHIVSLDQQMVLQLNLSASLKTLVPVINEAIIIMRHLTGIIFTELVRLTEHQIDLYSALEAALKHLHSPEHSPEKRGGA